MTPTDRFQKLSEACHVKLLDICRQRQHTESLVSADPFVQHLHGAQRDPWRLQ
jgi:hypothetical protein